MPKRKGEKYRGILEAAVKTFARSGYHRTRIADIAREAGVADGTVYIYFENKADILISLFQDMMSSFVCDLRCELTQIDNPGQKLNHLISYHLSTLNSRPAQARVTQIELRQIDQQINEGISRPLMAYFRLIEEVIDEGIKQGLYNAELDVKIARKAVFGAIDEVVTCWVMSKRHYDLGTLSEPLCALLTGALQKPCPEM